MDNKTCDLINCSLGMILSENELHEAGVKYHNRKYHGISIDNKIAREILANYKAKPQQSTTTNIIQIHEDHPLISLLKVCTGYGANAQYAGDMLIAYCMQQNIISDDRIENNLLNDLLGVCIINDINIRNAGDMLVAFWERQTSDM